MKSENILLIREISKNLEVDPDLAHAIATVESNCEFLAVRFEPNWETFLKVPQHAQENQISAMTEQVLQAMSWGPMQVMGTVCRELGYRGNLVELASQPNLSIYFGCVKLRGCLSRYKGSVPHAISSYNRGSAIRTVPDRGFANQPYVDKVTAVLHKLKEVTPI